MKAEYRRELRHLGKVRKKLVRDYNRFDKDFQRARAKLMKALERGHRARERELERVEQRMAILEGRLA